MGDSSVVMGVLPPPGSIPPLPAMSVIQNLGLSAGVVSISSVPSSTVAACNQCVGFHRIGDELVISTC